jgi:cytochrome c-type biogenesis protein CcmE
MFEFLTNNQLYVVLIVVLIIWLGLLLVLINLDKKITKLESNFRDLSNKNGNAK